MWGTGASAAQASQGTSAAATTGHPLGVGDGGFVRPALTNIIVVVAATFLFNGVFPVHLKHQAQVGKPVIGALSLLATTFSPARDRPRAGHSRAGRR